MKTLKTLSQHIIEFFEIGYKFEFWVMDRENIISDGHTMLFWLSSPQKSWGPAK